MSLVISSIGSDKNSSANYYGTVTISNKEIIRIYIELGREGGVVWEKAGWYKDTPVQKPMNEIAENWPKLYEHVRIATLAKNKLRPLQEVQTKHARREMRILEREIKDLEADIDLRRKRIRKLKEHV